MSVIKFCGLTGPTDIAAANELKPDFAGFVFAEKSKRYISPDTALELKKLLIPAIKAVGVFVNEEPGLVAELFGRGIIDIAQLHGEENEEYIRELRALADIPIIKAFRIRGQENIQEAAKSTADYLLLDAPVPGGGHAFDWGLLEGMNELKRDYFLAGGLNPENVGEALERLHPWGVDVSSGIEEAGIKSPKKMRAFAEAVRRGDSG